MNKLAIIPIFFLTMCGTAPVVDPPAHACSPRLDGKPTYCPDEKDLILLPRDKVTLPREEAKGEIDRQSEEIKKIWEEKDKPKTIITETPSEVKGLNDMEIKYDGGS